jgi:threonine dehydratase
MKQTVTYADIAAAAERIAPHVHRTPVLTSRSVDQRVGATVFFKCENLQRAGAFKSRGAFNTLLQLSPAERKRGVLAYSSGNHAQAVALAARELGIHAVIVMPLDAPEVKLVATRGYGAEVITYDRHKVDREAFAYSIAADRNLAVVPPFDHAHIVAGQGTAA